MVIYKPHSFLVFYCNLFLLESYYYYYAFEKYTHVNITVLNYSLKCLKVGLGSLSCRPKVNN